MCAQELKVITRMAKEVRQLTSNVASLSYSCKDEETFARVLKQLKQCAGELRGACPKEGPFLKETNAGVPIVSCARLRKRRGNKCKKRGICLFSVKLLKEQWLSHHIFSKTSYLMIEWFTQNQKNFRD